MSKLTEEIRRLSRKLDNLEQRLEKVEECLIPKFTAPEVPQEPKFKVGDKFIPHKPKDENGHLLWTTEMDWYDGKTLTVSHISPVGDLLAVEGHCWFFNPSWCTKVEEPYFPKDGEYFYAQFKVPYSECISIYSDIREHYGEQTIFDKATLFLCANDCYTGDSPLGAVKDIMNIRPATAEEKALLDSKLAENGLRFDKEKCEIVGVPKYKEPVVGKIAILWDNDRKLSVCRFFYMINDKGMFLDNSNMPWKNAILFESEEQYKNFLKQE